MMALLVHSKDTWTLDSAPWQPPPPTADDSDWIQLQSGEWLKGEIIVLYSGKLEFDSDELGTQIFDWQDISFLRTAQAVRVRLHSGERLQGKLRMANQTVEVIGSKKQLNSSQVLTITAKAPNEFYNWHIYMSIGANWRSGNTDQAETNGKIQLMRRSVASRLIVDYLGNFSETEEIQTVNNHRANGIWDYFIDEKLYLRPVFFEYFRDPFQNIDYQVTIGTGLGYQLIDTARTEWRISGGPGYQKTRFITVEEGTNISEDTPALSVGTALNIEISSRLDFNYDYKVQWTDESSGRYSHHMIAGFQLGLSDWLDFDVSLVWDRIEKPTPNEDGITPEQDDWRLIVGFGVEL